MQFFRTRCLGSRDEQSELTLVWGGTGLTSGRDEGSGAAPAKPAHVQLSADCSVNQPLFLLNSLNLQNPSPYIAMSVSKTTKPELWFAL